MSEGIYAAMSGAVARSMALDVVANNVANAPTNGFRQDVVTFREAPAAPPTGPAPADTELRLATVDAVTPSFRPGPLERTGDTFDIAIEGEGMLPVSTPQGVRFMRGGSLSTDSSGYLVSVHGNRLLDADGQPVQLPEEGDPMISEDGEILVDGEPVAALPLVWFDTPALLTREGDTLFVAGQGAGARQAEGQLRQGYVEGGNVNIVRGMVDMVSLTRSYEATLKAMESFSNIDRRTARDLGRG